MELFTLSLLNGISYGLLLFMLSAGLTLIFSLMGVLNFAHTSFYMLGAYLAYSISRWIGFWPALLLAPLLVGLLGGAFQRIALHRVRRHGHMAELLLTFGLALIIEGLFRQRFGISGLPYANPIPGGINLGFMFLPWFRGFIVLVSLVVCFGTWFVIEKTKLGSYLRAATENPDVVRAFGINVPLMITLTYGCGVALAGLAGVLAAPIYSVSPVMGSSLIIVVFAVVVIGGMGSILGSIVTGFGLGIVEGLTKVFYPEASATVIFVVMAIVLMIRPAGLFGTAR